MVNFYKTINEAFDKRYDSNTKKPLTEASAAHAHPDMSKKAGSISSMILSNKDRIDNATSLQDLRAVVEDILSPLEGNAKVTEINGRLRAMKDHVKALQYIYNIILKGDNLGTIKTGKAKERSKNEACGKKRSKKLTENTNKIFKLDRNYSWSRDGKNHPLYPIVMDILDDMGLFMKVSRGSCFFRQQFTNDAAGAMSCADFAEAMDALTQASNGKSMAEVYDDIEDFLWSDCISMDYKWHHDDGETYDFDAYDESLRRRRVNESSKRFDWDNLDVFEQTKIMKDFVRKYNGTKVFEDFADYIGVPVDDVIDLFTDAESRGFIQIPQEKQINSAYASTDIYESVRRRRVNESKRKLKESNTDWYSMDWDDQVNTIKRFVRNYRGTKVFEDFAASVGVDVDDVIDIFADLESYGIIYIPRKIQIDDKYMNNDIYESKRKLKEAASGTFNPDREYDWYEDGDVHPFLDIFDNALDELGLWSEPSIQGGNGYDYFYTKDGDREAGGVDFGIESDFINNLFQEMKGHSWAEIEDAIAEFVGDHAEYPDDYDEDEDEDDGGDADHDTPTLRLVKKILPKLKKYLGDAGYSCNLLVDFSTGKDVVTVHPSDSIQIDVAEIAPSDIVKAVKSSGLDINDQSISDNEWQAVFDKIITDAMTRRSGYGVIAFCSLEELSTYKGKDCSYLLEVRPGEKLLCVDVFVKSFQNGSFKEYPYMLLSYVPGVPKRNTVLGPNYRADYLQERDALKDIESKIKSIQANESFRRRRVNESLRRSRTTKKKIR